MQTNEEFFADKCMDLANYGVAGTIFGQALEGQVKWRVGLLGLAFFLFCSMISFILRKRGMRKNESG